MCLLSCCSSLILKHSTKQPGQCWEHVCSVTQSCPTLCHPMDYSPPGSSVHGILQARILEWVAISSSRGSSQPRDQMHVSCTGRRILYHWTTWEAHQIFIYLTAACGIQLPDQGSNPGPPAPGVQRPILWTTREISRTEKLGRLWSMGPQRIEHDLATKQQQLEFTFIIKDYSILRYYVEHLQFQANQFEGLFFSFFADNVQANFQPHGYNPSGALPKQKPLQLPQSTALSLWRSYSIRAFWNLKNRTHWVLRWLSLTDNYSLQNPRVGEIWHHRNA